MYNPSTKTKVINNSLDRDQETNFLLNLILEELRKMNIQFSLITDAEIKNKEVGK